jgi:hypothetical protein
MSSSGTSEKSADITDQARQPGNDASGDRHTEHAAGDPEEQDLRHVDGEDSTRGAPDALEDGNAAYLLLHEHARHARHANPAEDEHDQANETEIVLRPSEVLPHPIRIRPEAPAAHEFVGERRPQVRLRFRQPLTGHEQQELARDAAAEREQVG